MRHPLLAAHALQEEGGSLSIQPGRREKSEELYVIYSNINRMLLLDKR